MNVVTGDLNIRTNGTESAIVCTANAGVATYYDTAKKTETTSTGLDVTGVITADGLDIDDDHIIKVGTGDDFQIYHDGTYNYLLSTGTHPLIVEGDEIQLRAVNNEKYFKGTANGSVELYYDDTKEFETTSGGVKCNGYSEAVVFAGGSINSNPTINFNEANHFSYTLTGNVTFVNPSTEHIGQSGTITITQDGTGSRTAAWGDQFLWVGGTAPTLSTAANAVDRIDYVVVADGKIHCVASLALD